MKPFPKLLLVCLPGEGKQGFTPGYIEGTSTATLGQCADVGGGREVHVTSLGLVRKNKRTTVWEMPFCCNCEYIYFLNSFINV